MKRPFSLMIALLALLALFSISAPAAPIPQSATDYEFTDNSIDPAAILGFSIYPIDIMKGATYPWTLSIKTLITVTVKGPAPATTQIYNETIEFSSGTMAATRHIAITALGDYTVEEQYEIKAYSGSMLVFEADPVSSWTYTATAVGAHTLDFSASWHDLSATVTGDFSTNPSPYTVSGTLGSSVVVTVTCPDGVSAGDPVNTNIAFTGKLDKNTTITSGVTGPSIANPRATPSSLALNGTSSSLLTADISGTGISSVTVDLSSLNLSATQAMYDDGTHGDATPGDGTYSYSAVPALTAGISSGKHELTVTAVDLNGTETGTIELTIESPEITAVTNESGYVNEEGRAVVNISATPIVLNIIGSGFVQTATKNPTVSFGDPGMVVNSVTYQSGGLLEVTVTTASATPGLKWVTVQNPDGKGILSSKPLIHVTDEPPAPASDTVYPRYASQGATNLMAQITGNNFVGGCTVSFETSPGVPDPGITVIGPTTVNPAGTVITTFINIASTTALGGKYVTVTNPGNVSGTSPTTIFDVIGAPAISSVVPNSGEIGTTISVTINGTNLSGNNDINAGTVVANLPTISFGATPITVSDIFYVDTSQVTATFDLTAGGLTTGTYTFTFTNPGGVAATNQGTFSVINPPTVTSASPDIGNQGATNLDVEIIGTNFIEGAMVEFLPVGIGITVNSVTFNSSTSLTANIDIDSTATIGNCHIQVTNPGVGTTPGLGVNVFEIVGAPTITGITPDTANQGSYITHVLINGTNFIGTPAITFSGTGITVVSINRVSATQLDINLQIASTAPEGAQDLTITNSGGVSATLNNAFTVLGGITVTGVTPSSVNRGTAGFSLTISGTNFMTGSTITFSGTGIDLSGATYNYAGVPTSIVINNVAVTSSASLGGRNVTVTNPYGVTGTGNNLLTVLGPVDVTGIAPNVANVNATGVAVTIIGSNFITGATVTVGGCTVTSATVVNSTTINATLNTGAVAGTYDVTVTNASGSSDTLSNAFTLLAAPTVTAVDPNTGSQGATNMDIEITGTNFVPGATVSFSGTGITVNSVNVDSTLQTIDANITISATAGLTSRNVTVTCPGGVSATAVNAFTVIGAPSVTSVSPSSANIGVTNFPVTINGANFTSQSQVSFGAGVNVLATTFVNSMRLDVTISVDSTASVGARDVTVTNPGSVVGIGTNLFNVLDGLAVSSASPTSANRGATIDVSVFGVGFNSSIGAGDVSFGSGITINSVSYVSSNELSVNITVGAGATLGNRNISITVDGVTATGNSLFEVLGTPVVAAADPAQGSRGASMMSVTITGSNFVSGATVSFGSGIAVHSATVDSSTQITALISISPSATLGNRNIDVTNPGIPAVTGTNLFEVIGLPTITALNPSSGSRGMPSYDITMTGTNFADGASVSFSSTGLTVNSVTYVNGTELLVNIDISSTATLGASDVMVTNPGGVSATRTNAFTVLNAAPQVLSANPSSGSKGTTLDVQVIGQNFESGATVTFSGVGIAVNSVTFVDAQTLLANITIAATAPSGLRNITVTNPDTQTDTGIGLFAVGSDLTISTVYPSSAALGSTLDVAIYGTGFAAGTTASFGSGVTVNSVTYVSSTHIVANISVSSLTTQGSRDVTVTNPVGATATLTNGFTVAGSANLILRDSTTGNSTIYASVGDIITLQIWIDTLENINGVASYITFDTDYLAAVPLSSCAYNCELCTQGTFLNGTVLDNDRHLDPGNGIPGGQIDYVEVNPSVSATGTGVVATFQLEVIATPSAGYTVVSFDFDTINSRVTAFSVAGDSTFTPATTNATIYIGGTPPTGNTTLSGTVQLESRTDHSAMVTFEIRNTGSTTPLETQTVLTGTDGSYSLNLSVAAGTYDVAAKADGFLRQTLSGVTISGTGVNFSLSAGDVNGDNVVDLTDFNLLATSFGTALGDPDYNAACDFNGNGAIDLPDFAYLASNFSQTGDPAPGFIGSGFEMVSTSRPEIGKSFTIGLRSNVPALYAYAFQIEFDPADAEFLGVSKAGLAIDVNMISHIKTERPGLIIVLASLVGRNDGLTGAGDLVGLKFRLSSKDAVIRITNGSIITVKGLNEGVLIRVPDQLLRIDAVADVTALGQNYPNPFNPETWIPFQLSDTAAVKIGIFDTAGRLVRLIDMGKLDAGYYIDKDRAAYWDGRNESGERVSSGVYFYSLEAGNFRSARKMIILK